MTHYLEMMGGKMQRVLRGDARRARNPDRYYCPTTEATQWVTTWQEFKDAGGNIAFNEDQTEIELLLPEPYKFGVTFMRQP